jgi:hypothetical protein
MNEHTNSSKAQEVNIDHPNFNPKISSVELAVKAAIGGVSIGTLVGSAAAVILGSNPIGIGLGVGLGALSAAAWFSSSYEKKDNHSTASEHE